MNKTKWHKTETDPALQNGMMVDYKAMWVLLKQHLDNRCVEYTARIQCEDEKGNGSAMNDEYSARDELKHIIKYMDYVEYGERIHE